MALKSAGLGSCCKGTALHSMGGIAEFRESPDNCLPVTSMVVGWPAEAPAQRDRLPPSAWIREECYQRPSAADTDTRFAVRERRGGERYLAMGPEMAARWAEHGITSLAPYGTSKIKHDPDLFARDSAALEARLRSRGFLV